MPHASRRSCRRKTVGRARAGTQNAAPSRKNFAWRRLAPKFSLRTNGQDKETTSERTRTCACPLPEGLRIKTETSPTTLTTTRNVHRGRREAPGNVRGRRTRERRTMHPEVPMCVEARRSGWMRRVGMTKSMTNRAQASGRMVTQRKEKPERRRGRGRARNERIKRPARKQEKGRTTETIRCKARRAAEPNQSRRGEHAWGLARTGAPRKKGSSEPRTIARERAAMERWGIGWTPRNQTRGT